MTLKNKPIKNILVTGGAGFIGSALIRKLLDETSFEIFNLDKISYSSDLSRIDSLFDNKPKKKERYKFIQADLSNDKLTQKTISYANPDIIFHLAAESHVDRSIDSPKEFVNTNVVGTFNLLRAATSFWESLPEERKRNFGFYHISTDEVFGSLGKEGLFSEQSRYEPRSPYAASKASSDHLAKAWYHTYGLPVIISNCSNNFGPWQFPEKLIPLVIIKALKGENIPLYGDGSNIRDWLFIDDHIEALIKILELGEYGHTYCIGGNNEKTNKEVVNNICNLLNEYKPTNYSYHELIKNVIDRPGHDQRYAIDSTKIRKELGWLPKINFNDGLKKTVLWYLENLNWAESLLIKSGYEGERLGLNK